MTNLPMALTLLDSRQFTQIRSIGRLNKFPFSVCCLLTNGESFQNANDYGPAALIEIGTFQVVQ
jgi:hypothetical protein